MSKLGWIAQRSNAKELKFQFALVIHSLQRGVRAEVGTSVSIIWSRGPRTAMSEKLPSLSNSMEAAVYRWPTEKPLMLLATLFRNKSSGIVHPKDSKIVVMEYNKRGRSKKIGEIIMELSDYVDPDGDEFAKESTWHLLRCSDPSAMLTVTVVSMAINESKFSEEKLSAVQVAESARRRGHVVDNPNIVDSAANRMVSYGAGTSSDEEDMKQDSSVELEFYSAPANLQECDAMLLFADNRKEKLKALISDGRSRDIVQLLYLRTELAAVRKRIQEIVTIKMEMIIQEAERKAEIQELGKKFLQLGGDIKMLQPSNPANSAPSTGTDHALPQTPPDATACLNSKQYDAPNSETPLNQSATLLDDNVLVPSFHLEALTSPPKQQLIEPPLPPRPGTLLEEQFAMSYSISQPTVSEPAGEIQSSNFFRQGSPSRPHPTSGLRENEGDAQVNVAGTDQIPSTGKASPVVPSFCSDSPERGSYIRTDSVRITVQLASPRTKQISLLSPKSSPFDFKQRLAARLGSPASVVSENNDSEAERRRERKHLRAQRIADLRERRVKREQDKQRRQAENFLRPSRDALSDKLMQIQQTLDDVTSPGPENYRSSERLESDDPVDSDPAQKPASVDPALAVSSEETDALSPAFSESELSPESDIPNDMAFEVDEPNVKEVKAECTPRPDLISVSDSVCIPHMQTDQQKIDDLEKVNFDLQLRVAGLTEARDRLELDLRALRLRYEGTGVLDVRSTENEHFKECSSMGSFDVAQPATVVNVLRRRGSDTKNLERILRMRLMNESVRKRTEVFSAEEMKHRRPPRAKAASDIPDPSAVAPAKLSELDMILNNFAGSERSAFASFGAQDDNSGSDGEHSSSRFQRLEIKQKALQDKYDKCLGLLGQAQNDARRMRKEVDKMAQREDQQNRDIAALLETVRQDEEQRHQRELRAELRSQAIRAEAEKAQTQDTMEALKRENVRLQDRVSILSQLDTNGSIFTSKRERELSSIIGRLEAQLQEADNTIVQQMETHALKLNQNQIQLDDLAARLATTNAQLSLANNIIIGDNSTSLSDLKSPLASPNKARSEDSEFFAQDVHSPKTSLHRLTNDVQRLRMKYERSKASLQKMSTYATRFELELVSKSSELSHLAKLVKDIAGQNTHLTRENARLKEMLRAQVRS